MVQYIRLDPASSAGATVLATHFISQSPPDIRKKLKKAEEGPQTPIQELLKMAFNVFNAREETAVFLLKQAVMLRLKPYQLP